MPTIIRPQLSGVAPERRRRTGGTIRLIFTFIAPCLASTWGATYTVSPDGSGAYETVQACANAAVAGDTCVVSPGNYAEFVTVSNSGTASAPITIAAAYPVNGPTTLATQRSTIKGFRIRGAYVTVNGFDITRYDVGLNFGHITVDAGGSGCRITNNVIRDGIWMSSSKYYFDASSHTITNEAGGFLAAGFVPGVRVYIGSDINNQILNHDTIKQVTAVTDKTLTVTDVQTSVSNWQMSTEGPVQSTIYVTRADKGGVTGIHFTLTSGAGASGCVISKNKLTNLAGAGILTIVGSNTLIEDNVLDRMHGWRFITLSGSNNVFRRNVFRDSPRWAGFPPPDRNVYHSPGVGTWDMYASFLYSTATQTLPVRNNLFEFNIVKDIANSMAQVEYLGETAYGTDLIIRNNVFVGVESTGSLHYPRTQVVNNTFVNSAFNSVHHFVIADSLHGAATGSVVKNNVFVGVGSTPDLSGQRGWYHVDPSFMATPPNYNFVSGPASAGYPPKAGFTGQEVNGINGGDPQFQNINDPLGPDGAPFTADDGLTPRVASPLCGRGESGGDIGAYSCSAASQPSAPAPGGVTQPSAPAPTGGSTLPSGPSYTVSAAGTGDYTTIQACANAAKPGDTCVVQAGTYNEHVNTASGGIDDARRVTFRANGKVTMQGFHIRHPYVTVDGFDITGFATSYQGAVTVTSTGNYCQIINNNIHDVPAQGISGVSMMASSGVSASNCLVRGNTLARLTGPMLNVNGDNHLFESNYLSENASQDFIRLFGSGSTFRRNVFWRGNTSQGTGNHPDFVQTFGSASTQSQNHVFEENWISDLPGAQFSQLNSADGVIAKAILYNNVKNITFRRNVFADIPLNANVGIPGVRFENNTFYRLSSTASGILFGASLTRGFSAQGAVVNNIFLDGGSGRTGTGYYQMAGAVYTREVIGLLVTGEGICQSACAAAGGIYANLQANGYIGVNGAILEAAINLKSVTELVLDSAYSGYKQKVYDTLVATVQMDQNVRSTFYADYNFIYPNVAAGVCDTGRYYNSSQRWCEQHGINGQDGQFANVSNLLGPDGIPFTLDDGLKPRPTSPVCAMGLDGVDIGAYSCDPNVVIYKNTALLPPTDVTVTVR